METIAAFISEGAKAFRASGAITKGQIVKFSSEGVVAAAGLNEAGIGIADSDAADGAIVVVRLVGGAEVIAGAALATPGTFVKSDANGRAIAIDADKDKVIGYTVGVSTAAGDIIPIVIYKSLASV